MCKCKIGECVYAQRQDVSTGIITCGKLGDIKPIKGCDEFVQFVEIDEKDTDLNISHDAHVKCPHCGVINDLYDIPYDEYIDVTCEECGTRFMCMYYYN